MIKSKNHKNNIFLLGAKMCLCMLFVLLFFWKSNAQNFDYITDTSEYYEPFDIPKYRVGFSYSAVMDYPSAIQISQDFRLNQFTELSLEIGYISGLFTERKGFKFRPSIEMYLLRDEVAGLFIGAALNTTNQWQLYNYTLQHEGKYFREYRDVRQKSQFGMFLTGGFKIKLSDLVYWETSMGFGVSRRYNSELPLPDNPFINIWEEGNGWNTRPLVFLNGNISVPLIVD